MSTAVSERTPSVADGLAWQDRALCRKSGVATKAFYPVRGTKADEAKEVCALCPVRYECLADAIERGDRHGVWGGLTERERRPLRRAYQDHR